MTIRMLRRVEVERITGLSRSTLYDLMSRNLFPRPIAIARHAVAWPETEIAALNAARMAERDEDEIKKLVTRLVAARVQAYEQFKTV